MLANNTVLLCVVVLCCGCTSQAVVLVSHDEHFLSRVAKEFWCVKGGELSHFNQLNDAKQYAYGDQ